MAKLAPLDISDHLRKRLERYCERSGLQRAEVVRAAIAYYLDARGEPTSAPQPKEQTNE